MDVMQDQRFIIDRVGEEIDLEECSFCFASSCFSCVSDHCTALKKLSDGDCVFYKDHEEDHKEIWRCFYRLIRCQRFDLLIIRFSLIGFRYHDRGQLRLKGKAIPEFCRSLFFRISEFSQDSGYEGLSGVFFDLSQGRESR